MRATGGLEGVRVIVIPDPRNALCTRMLADMGADVVLLEPPEGQPLRRLSPHAQGSEEGLLFWYATAGCRSFMVDSSSDEGREQVVRLVAKADVLIESKGLRRTLGLELDGAELTAQNPGLVYASLTDFGQTGPNRGCSGSDIVAWAMSGMMSLTGVPDREPLTAPAMQAYQVGSLWAVLAIQAAIFRRLKTGHGARIDLSLQETALDMSETAHSFFLCNREDMPRTGGEHPMGVPFKVYQTEEGHAFIGGGSIGQWGTLIEWMKSHGVESKEIDDPKLEVSRERLKRRGQINAAVADFAMRVGHQELYRYGASIGMGTAPVRTVDETLKDDQLSDRGFFWEMRDPRSDKQEEIYLRPGLPFREAQTNFDVSPTTPPRIGEHNTAVTAEWSQPGLRWPEACGVKYALPLEGVAVVDLCWNVAGPIMGRVLGDLGGAVTKVEPREIGDPGRMLPPFPDHYPHHNRSYTFQDNNRNKSSMTINLKHPGALSLALDLVKCSDVVLENFTTGTLSRLGLPFSKLREVNPSVILGSITGYGQTGPRASWPSYHPTSSALSGLTALFAYEGGEPQGFGNSYMDFCTGYTGAIGVLDALIRRQRSGNGRHVDISQLESAVSLVGTQVLDWTVNRHRALPEGNNAGALGAVLQGCFRCAGDDQWIVVTAHDHDELSGISGVVNHMGKFSPGSVMESLEQWALHQDCWDAFHLLQRAHVPAGVVSKGHDLIERDIHLATRAVVRRVRHDELGGVPIVQCPVVLDGHRLSVRTAAPLLGEHTENILRKGLGLSEEEYLDYVVREVV